MSTEEAHFSAIVVPYMPIINSLPAQAWNTRKVKSRIEVILDVTLPWKVLHLMPKSVA